jgi:hypothetical protein
LSSVLPALFPRSSRRDRGGSPATCGRHRHSGN